MARKLKGYDTGFDIDFEDFEKALKKMEQKYENKADAVLMAAGRAATNKVKAKTPVGKKKKLKGSWRLKKVKEYRGVVKVVRIQSDASHAHLVEEGHAIIKGGKTRVRGRTLNTVERKIRGIQNKGRVEGVHMLESTMKPLESGFLSDVEKFFNDLTKEVEL